MNWVDLVVIALAILAAVSGARQGVVTALPAFIGVLLGAIAGIKIAPLVVQYIESTPTRVAFAVAIFVLLVALGETLGVWLGRSIRQKIKSPKAVGVDNALGAVVQGAVVFVVAWLIALPLVTVGGLPSLASAIRGSVVLGGVNNVMPSAAQNLPDELRRLLDVSGFPAVVDPFDQTPNREVAPPDPALQGSEVVQRVRESVLKIHARAPSCSRALEGTGFVISEERMMTNAHVVAGTNEVTVETQDGTLDARVVHYDPETDVAVLSVPGLTAPALPFAPRPAESGQDGIVLGYPLDGPYTASPARVRDQIDLRGPDIYDANTVQREVFTLRALVRSGNSGGALVDMNGNVVGINASIRSNSSSSEQAGSIGLGFAIPIDEVLPIIDQLKAGDDATHARMGISVGDSGASESGESSVTGATIQDVTKDSAAEKAGLEKGDTITKVDEHQINGSDSLVATVRSYRPGDDVEVTWSRDGEEQSAKITLDSDAT